MDAIVEKGIIYPSVRTDCQWKCRITLYCCRERIGVWGGAHFCGWDVRSLHGFDGDVSRSSLSNGGVWRLRSRWGERKEPVQKKKISLIKQSDLFLSVCVCVFMAHEPEMQDRAPTPVHVFPKGWGGGALNGATPHSAMAVYGAGHKRLGDHQNVKIMMWSRPFWGLQHICVAFAPRFIFQNSYIKENKANNLYNTLSYISHTLGASSPL